MLTAILGTSSATVRAQTDVALYSRALKELWSRLLIVGVGEVADGAFPSLAMSATRHRFEELWPDEALLGRSPDLVRPPRFGVLSAAMRARRDAALRAAAPAGFASLPGFLERCGACRENLAVHEAEAEEDLSCEAVGIKSSYGYHRAPSPEWRNGRRRGLKIPRSLRA